MRMSYCNYRNHKGQPGMPTLEFVTPRRWLSLVSAGVDRTDTGETLSRVGMEMTQPPVIPGAEPMQTPAGGRGGAAA
jgi:hypothetical protein